MVKLSSVCVFFFLFDLCFVLTCPSFVNVMILVGKNVVQFYLFFSSRVTCCVWIELVKVKVTEEFSV